VAQSAFGVCLLQLFPDKETKTSLGVAILKRAAITLQVRKGHASTLNPLLAQRIVDQYIDQVEHRKKSCANIALGASQEIAQGGRGSVVLLLPAGR
jgi:hypothetical protein